MDNAEAPAHNNTLTAPHLSAASSVWGERDHIIASYRPRLPPLTRLLCRLRGMQVTQRVCVCVRAL